MPAAKELRKLLGRRQVILREVADDIFRYVRSGDPVVSEADLFAKRFRALGCGLFDDWTRDDWSNVLVAGGAVLLCALPLPPNYSTLRAKSSGFDFDFRNEARFRCFDDDGGAVSEDDFVQRRRWPGADIDIFFHGLDAEDAHAKLFSLLRKLRRTVKMREGIDHDVVFVKTPNTVTLETGSPRRKIQFITRLYSSAAEILNGFDIDCCCLGFDGREATITERAVEALRTRVNTVNLDIRGECYEMRLLKYATRGFAIAAPHLDRGNLDRTWFDIERVKCDWGDWHTISSHDFSKWGQSRNLERLLLAEAISRSSGGYIDNSFQGRRRSMPGKAVLDTFAFKVKPNVLSSDVADGYGGYIDKGRDGAPVWPATTQMVVMEKAERPKDPRQIHSRATWFIHWTEGNMPRKPLNPGEWVATSLPGGTREPLTWTERRERRERERNAAAAVPHV